MSDGSIVSKAEQTPALSTAGLLLNLAAFYLCWFACVLGAARGYPWLGPVVVAVWIVIHVLSVPKPGRELAFILGVGALGYVLDSILVLLGVLDFVSRGFGTVPAPLWMVALWMSFATSFHGALHWLSGRFLMGAIFGMLGGPAAYLAGQRLGAVGFGVPTSVALFAIGIVWLIAMLLILQVERHRR